MRQGFKKLNICIRDGEMVAKDHLNILSIRKLVLMEKNTALIFIPIVSNTSHLDIVQQRWENQHNQKERMQEKPLASIY